MLLLSIVPPDTLSVPASPIVFFVLAKLVIVPPFILTVAPVFISIVSCMAEFAEDPFPLLAKTPLLIFTVVPVLTKSACDVISFAYTLA